MKKNVTAEHFALIHMMRSQGSKAEQIATGMGFCKATIWNVLKCETFDDYVKMKKALNPYKKVGTATKSEAEDVSKQKKIEKHLTEVRNESTLEKLLKEVVSLNAEMLALQDKQQQLMHELIKSHVDLLQRVETSKKKRWF